MNCDHGGDSGAAAGRLEPLAGHYYTTNYSAEIGIYASPFVVKSNTLRLFSHSQHDIFSLIARYWMRNTMKSRGMN